MHLVWTRRSLVTAKKTSAVNFKDILKFNEEIFFFNVLTEYLTLNDALLSPAKLRAWTWCCYQNSADCWSAFWDSCFLISGFCVAQSLPAWIPSLARCVAQFSLMGSPNSTASLTRRPPTVAQLSSPASKRHTAWHAFLNVHRLRWSSWTDKSLCQFFPGI